MTRRAAPGSLFGAIVRLAVFNPSGLNVIGTTREAFLASFSPLLSFLLVGTTLEMLALGWREGLTDGLNSLCVLLGQPVLSHFVARLMKRDANWLRYATAMNWCQLAIPVVALVFVLVASAAVTAATPQALLVGVLGTVVAYAVLLNWFLAWRGLELPPGRAVLFVLGVMGCLFVLLALPMLARLALSGALGGHAALGSVAT